MASEVAALPMENLVGELEPMAEAEFRSYAVRSKAAEEIIKLLVGLSESNARPENAAKFLRDQFDAELELTDEPKEDVKAILAENAELKAQLAALAARVDELRAKIPPAQFKISRLAVTGVPAREGQQANGRELYMRVELRSYLTGEDDAQAVQTSAVPMAADATFGDELTLALPAARDASQPPVLCVTLWDVNHASEGAQPLAAAEVVLPDQRVGDIAGVDLPSEIAEKCQLQLRFEIVALPRQARPQEAGGE
jgi:hypothetical protein